MAKSKKTEAYRASERRALRACLAHIFISSSAKSRQAHILSEFENFTHRLRTALDDPDKDVTAAVHEYLLESLTFTDCEHKMPAEGERCELCGYVRKTKGWQWDKNKKSPQSPSRRKRSSAGSKP